MNYSKGLLTGIGFTLLCVGGAWGTWWALSKKPSAEVKSATAPPANIAKPLKEDQLNAITLSPEAVARLDLKLGTTETKPMPRRRFYGGEVIVPPGRTAVVSAPVSGVLQAAGDKLPTPGERIEQGQPIFSLLPLLTPEGRANLAAANIDAEGQLKSAETQLQATQVALARAKRVLQGEAGSQRAVDEAQAQYDLALKSVEAAAARREVLKKIAGDAEAGTAGPLAIDSPQSGTLRNLSAQPGQEVPAGGPLFEVVDLTRVWIRVPVYVGTAPQIDAAASAIVSDLAPKPETKGRPAVRVAAPPSANALTGTLDLYFELDNADPKYSPGQRVGVSLPLATEAESLTVPWSAVVYDIYGGAWVYTETGERAYARQRIVVRHVVKDTAVLASGPAPGTKVVVAGAAELFGTETGFSK